MSEKFSDSRSENRSTSSLKSANELRVYQELKRWSNWSYKMQDENESNRADRIAKAYKYDSLSPFKNGKSDVFKFQKEWNRSNPKDPIIEDGILWEQTQVRYIEYIKKLKLELIRKQEVLINNHDQKEVSQTLHTLVISSAPIQQSFQRKIESISNAIKTIQQHARENTTIIAKVGDSIIGALWWETGEDIYKRSMETQKQSAQRLVNEINTSILNTNERHLLIQQISTILNTKFETVPWNQATSNELSTENMKQNAKYALNWGVWIAKWMGEVAKSVFDLTIGTIKYTFDTKYRNTINEEIKKVYDYAESNYISTNGMSKIWADIWKVTTIIQQELYRIMNLPGEQQAEAIGKLSWTIIGMLGGVKAAQALGKVAVKWAQKVEQATRIGERVSTGSERAARIAKLKMQAIAAKTIAQASNIILWGLAENALTAVVSKSYFSMKATLVSATTSISEKLNAIKNTSIETTSALASKLSDQTRAAMEDLQERLEALIEQLEQMMNKKNIFKSQDSDIPQKQEEPKQGNQAKESPKWEDFWDFFNDKKIDPTNLDDRKLYKLLISKYHPDKNISNTDLANKISQSINAANDKKLRGELEMIARDPEWYLREKNKWGTEKADYYTFKDGSTVESWSFDNRGNGQGQIKRPDGARHQWTFERWELRRWKVYTTDWWIFRYEKGSKNPLISENDARTKGAINRWESIHWSLPTMKWTHRTTIDILEKILQTWKIWTNWERWVNLWWGLWAWYGDITFIMKKEVQDIRAARGIQDVKRWGWSVPEQDNMVYFFWSQSKWNGMTMQEYTQKFWDFTSNRIMKWENPNLNDPYLMVGERWTDFDYEVWANLIESVILPAHARSYPNYQEIVAWLKQSWIKIIEAPTSPTILNYSGWSILNVVAWWRSAKWAYAQAIIKELWDKYPWIHLEEAAIMHLKSTGAIPKDSKKSFIQLKNEYNEVAKLSGLSRGSALWWEFENYASHKNHTIEQQAYFTYLVDSKYVNLSEMPQKELISLLKWYLEIPEALSAKWVSASEVKNLIQVLESGKWKVDEIVYKHTSGSTILQKLAA